MANTSKKIAYLIGIKGVGMAALAQYLQQDGFAVSGSDEKSQFPTDEILKKSQIEVLEGFDAKNLQGKKPDLVIASAAYDKDNPEIKIAKKRHLNFYYYSEILGQISSSQKVIAVSGIHGKTTIASMIAFVLEKSGLDPSFIIGAAKVAGLDSVAKKGEGEYFVVEADEYRKSPEDSSPKFLDLTSQIAIISSIELDHPDIFSSIEDVYNAFYALACRVPRDGYIVLCVDYPKAKKLHRSLVDRDFETYGFDLSAKWRIINVNETPAGSTFSLELEGKIYGPFFLKIPGKHNILNATSVIIIALKLDISVKKIAKFLSQFGGAQRRFEEKAKIKDLVIIDDYAHHPTAIKGTLESAKKRYPKSKIFCIFQPHTFSRTERLLEDFGESFKNADRVVITDIFASAREEKGKTSGLSLAEEIKKNQKGVRFFDDWQKILKYLDEAVEPPAVIITMGAGDIYKLGEKIIAQFQEKIQNG